MHLLPSSWQTERLVMRDASLDDVARLREIFNACSYVEPWDETFKVYPEEEFRDLVEQSMKGEERDGKIFRLQPIRTITEETIVGYFHLYHGDPRPHVAFISMMVIDPLHQKHRYGAEVVDGLAEQLKSSGYNAIWLSVNLKNLPALRFWIAAGFTTIVEYRGEKVLAETGHAKMILERKLG